MRKSRDKPAAISSPDSSSPGHSLESDSSSAEPRTGTRQSRPAAGTSAVCAATDSTSSQTKHAREFSPETVAEKRFAANSRGIDSRESKVGAKYSDTSQAYDAVRCDAIRAHQPFSSVASSQCS